jgi:hypothetical protein
MRRGSALYSENLRKFILREIVERIFPLKVGGYDLRERPSNARKMPCSVTSLTIRLAGGEGGIRTPDTAFDRITV